MAVRRLTLTDFRNHGALDMRVSHDFILLCGANGMGKTNVLEGLSLMVPGRGLRAAPLAEMARQGGPGHFSVAADVDGARLGTGTLAASPNRREVRIQGARAAAGDLAEWLAAVWLTPAMDRLFMEGATGRRRFLDRLVLALYPAHAGHSSRYERALRERNRLLSGEGAPDPAWLDALEAALAHHGAAIAAARRQVVADLSAHIAAQADGPFARPDLSLDDGAEMAEDALRARLRAMRGTDRAAGRTLTGPHRSDLFVRHRAKDRAAAQCSTGEQKAMLLAIVLAHADLVRQQRGAPPILLLDEVTAHLDPERRAILFTRLADMGVQAWMTGTDRALFDGVARADWFLFAPDGGIEQA